ncbi:MAG: hypothetical protein A2V83_07710 [Nitrospirae bacterium RBG_16_64_22]|nr:MAG: hypothetical protein A2V83_07710 [Nitrospirae bacterium RBG_16_64_22]
MKTKLLGALIVLGATLLPTAALAQPAIGVNAFRGTGPNSQMGKGLADMLISDLVNNKTFQKCHGTVVEMMKRDLVLKELKLCREHPDEFDQSRCLREGMLIDPTAVVDGTVVTTEHSITWSLQMRDPATGKVIGGSKGSASGDDVFKASEKIAEQLARQACREGMDYTSTPRTPPGAPNPPAPAQPRPQNKPIFNNIRSCVNSSTTRSMQSAISRDCSAGEGRQAGRTFSRTSAIFPSSNGFRM